MPLFMPQNTIDADQAAATCPIVVRPQAVLMELPMAIRWEVTRRHAYYLLCWETAHRHHEQASADTKLRGIEKYAVLMLQAIGVTGDPPPPRSSFEDLGAEQLSGNWLSGAVAPFTLRSHVAALLVGLPADARARVGQLLQKSAVPDEEDSHPHQSLLDLSTLKDPALDSFPIDPMLGINVHAPQRIIIREVNELMRQWKQQRGIREKRRRDDKPEKYLEVWDLREGWTGDHYDIEREKTLADVARQLRISLPTASNCYKSAFRLIVGHDYTPELWIKVFAVDRLFGLTNPSGKRSKRVASQVERIRTLNLVTEATLSAGIPCADSGSRILDTISVKSTAIDEVSMMIDIRDLIALGRSNEQILDELELSAAYAQVVEYCRQRHAERLF